VRKARPGASSSSELASAASTSGCRVTVLDVAGYKLILDVVEAIAPSAR
jgi:hypothetical protein